MILTHGANSLNRGGGGAVIGGRTYRTVVMPDGKEWLAENLDYKFDVNGSQIPIGGSGSPTTPAAWYYNNNETDYGIDGTYKCGLLYNWYAVKYLDDNRSTLLPDGWRATSDNDWINLTTNYGGSGSNSPLKASNNSVVQGFPSNWGGSGELGFNILPTGGHPLDGPNAGRFIDFNGMVYYWTTYDGGTYCHARWMTSSSVTGVENYSHKKNAFYIRLVKDAT